MYHQHIHEMRTKHNVILGFTWIGDQVQKKQRRRCYVDEAKTHSRKDHEHTQNR